MSMYFDDSDYMTKVVAPKAYSKKKKTTDKHLRFYNPNINWTKLIVFAVFGISASLLVFNVIGAVNDFRDDWNAVSERNDLERDMKEAAENVIYDMAQFPLTYRRQGPLEVREVSNNVMVVDFLFSLENAYGVPTTYEFGGRYTQHGRLISHVIREI